MARRLLELYELTFSRMRAGLSAREFSSRELTESVLDRTASVEPTLSAFITIRDRAEILAEAERADADRADAALAGGEAAPLCGVPVAIKDNISTAGIRTTCGSRMLEGYVPPYDATAVARLRAAGAIILGKTNLDEFAMGSSNENSAFGATRNPWDTDRVPGGSSGGSAAAVASGEVPLALGSDTGGSVRQPAGFCGVVGVKPTYGRVSRYGLVAFASSLDSIGTLSRDVAGAAALLEVIAGVDGRDSTTADEPVPSIGSADADLAGVRIGLPEEYFSDGLDPSVERAVVAAADVLKGLGAAVTTVSIPHLAYGIPAYYLVADAEASANLARYDGVQYGRRSSDAADIESVFCSSRSEGLGAEVRRRIMLGTYALSAGYYDDYYLKAQKVRTLLMRDFDRAFESVDAIVGPTSPTAAFPLGERMNDPISMYLSDVYTVPANLAGLPAVSVPCGTDAAGLPVGLQITANRFREGEMLRLAAAYERAAGPAPGPAPGLSPDAAPDTASGSAFERTEP